jgi:hypothetical protein
VGSTATVPGCRTVGKRVSPVSASPAVDGPTTSSAAVGVTHSTEAVASWASPYGVPGSGYRAVSPTTATPPGWVWLSRVRVTVPSVTP